METKRKLVVILDPAHGDNIAGKRSPDGTHLEYLWSRDRCKELHTKLKLAGFQVEYTNTSTSEIGLSKRKAIADALQVEEGKTKFLLSLHNNAAGSGQNWMKARGFEIYTTTGQTRSDEFADIIMKDLMEAFPATEGYTHRMDLSDGDLDKEANFTILMGKSYSAVLLEWLFQDNPNDVSMLRNTVVNERLVDTLVKSMINIDKTL